MPSRLERLILLDQELRRAYYPNVERLCQLFEVQPRTVYQDIKDLRERLGLDIRFDRARGGYHNANPDKKLPAFSLTEEELFALFLGAALIRAELDAPGRTVVELAVRKLLTASASEMGQHAQTVFDKVSIANKLAQPISLAKLHKLFLAALAGSEVSVDDASGVAQDKVTAVQLQCKTDGWFLLAIERNQHPILVPLGN